jgi:hypothetical protein
MTFISRILPISSIVAYMSNSSTNLRHLMFKRLVFFCLNPKLDFEEQILKWKVGRSVNAMLRQFFHIFSARRLRRLDRTKLNRGLLLSDPGRKTA